MSENRARYPIAVMCRILGVSPSGYYAWVKRPTSARALMDIALTAEIRAAHAASKGTYGAPRLQFDLVEAGIRVSRKRVARLMRNAGLVGVSRRKSTVKIVRDRARQAPDLVDRDFTADQPNKLWVADITYIPTWAGFLYLAVVLDAFSRRIVGWSMATTLHMQVVLCARSPESEVARLAKEMNFLSAHRSSSPLTPATQSFSAKRFRMRAGGPASIPRSAARCRSGRLVTPTAR